MVMSGARTQSRKLGKTSSYHKIYDPTSRLYWNRFASKAGSQQSKKLYELTRQLTDINNHLETLPNNKTSKLLLDSVKEVIGLVTSYREKTRDLPFDWIIHKFAREEYRGAKLSYPDGKSYAELMGWTPDVIFAESDDECDTVERSLKDPNFSRLGKLNRVISELLVDPTRHDMFTNFFDGHDKQTWLEFKELNEGFREGEEKRSIEVDHPIVRVVGNFAVAAFNKACKKHVKKGQPSNLHGFQFMECNFSKVSQAYHFYMIIKAIEGRKRGTYMAEVVCRTCDDAIALCNFVKTIGTKALAVSYLTCLESICQTIDDLYKEKMNRLRDIYNGLHVPEVYIAACEMQRLEKFYRLTKKGLQSRLKEDRQRHLQPYSIRTGPKQASTLKGKTKLWRY